MSDVLQGGRYEHFVAVRVGLTQAFHSSTTDGAVPVAV